MDKCSDALILHKNATSPLKPTLFIFCRVDTKHKYSWNIDVRHGCNIDYV